MSAEPQQALSDHPRDDPGHPRSPLELPLASWRKTIARTLQEVKQDRITITAAGVAFYWFLSLFPLLFAAIAIISIVKVSPAFVQQLNDGFTAAVPGDAADVLQGSLASAQGRAVGSVGSVVVALVFALWTASSGMAATQVGLDVAYDVVEDRGFLKRRAIGLVLLGAAFVLGGVAIALVVFGRPIGDAIAGWLSAQGVFDVVWNIGRWVVGLLAVTTLIALFYDVGPNRRPPGWQWLTPGGIIATVLWVIASLGFSFYVSHFGGSYAHTYGAIAGVVILVLWLYLTAIAILVGAELNGELERQRADAAERSHVGDERDAA